jgi:hypothetical protein
MVDLREIHRQCDGHEFDGKGVLATGRTPRGAACVFRFLSDRFS